MPFLILRDKAGEQQIVELTGDALTIGRRPESEVSLGWDVSVSRIHARLERVGSDWTLLDDGLSRHGTFVNGERIDGRRRLEEGDTIFVGDTSIAYVQPLRREESQPTAPPISRDQVHLTPAQKRVLIALCRPFKTVDVASPAGNRQIAADLVVSIDAVKARLKELFEAFGIKDLPPSEKRAALAREALRRGTVTRKDL